MTEPDDLYSGILRELYSPAWLRRSGRDSYGALAKKLGVDDETVRRTINRMQSSGFLKSWSAFPNPHVLGMECASVVFDVKGRTKEKAKLIAQLRLIDGVVALFNFVEDQGLRLILYYSNQSDLERKTRLLTSICGPSPSVSWEVPFPPCRVNLKATDWRIILYLMADSRKSLPEIAQATGVSTRTVTRRLDEMTENNAFFLSQNVDAKRVDGFIYHFVVSFIDERSKSASVGELQGVPKLIFADTNARRHAVVSAICRNISEASRISDWIRALDGVSDVQASILEDIIYVQDWIEDEIERESSNSDR